MPAFQPAPARPIPARPGGLLAAAILALLLAACGQDATGPAAEAGPEAGGGASPARPAGADEAPRRPHIVLYLIDTLRADRLGCYGYERDTSPVLDRLAAAGVRVEQALSQAPWTLPSCVSLQTSTYVVNHGVISGTYRAPRDVTLLVEFLHDLGYTTAGFVHNRLGASMAGLDQGYDHLVERPSTRDLSDDDRAKGLHTLQPFHDWIAEQDGSAPLFTYIHTSEPHHPYLGTYGDGQRFAPVSREKRDELNGVLGKHRGLLGTHDLNQDLSARDEYAALTQQLRADLPALNALYDGDVRRADENVGKVIDALRRQGLWEDTIFVLIADHGEEFFEHGNWFHDQSVHGELVHVPMILRIPGLADHGRPLPGPVQLIDVAPTLAELLDAKPPAQWLGRSLVPDLTTLAAGGTPPESSAFTQRINVDRQLKTLRGRIGDRETALVRGRWKAILRHDVDRLLLFDLDADPGESVDLAAAQPERAAALRGAIEDFLRAQRNRRLPLPLDKGQDDAETQAALQQLGYLDAGGSGERSPLEAALDLLGEDDGQGQGH